MDALPGSATLVRVLDRWLNDFPVLYIIIFVLSLVVLIQALKIVACCLFLAFCEHIVIEVRNNTCT